MNNINKIERLIDGLQVKTQTNEIHWKNSNPPNNLTAGTEEIFSLFLKSNFNGQDIGIYEKRYKYFYDHEPTSFIWAHAYGLCILQNNKVIFTYEKNSPALAILFEMATAQNADIDSLISQL
ncbi:hypothetical protein [Moraxella nonliquefaciens]|jgi:hypothetical protein|uniref:Uncharacterized protein n=1 Tax=Moraxella nonliquefaciens TaxID=478 RepID=A0A1B8PIJ8_MORNO|nr:hypothetical protein [Moraxella nonliquefaciens]OBX49512.1 hypothetical protein A9Z60_03880 [Moraxella nonliquefaciens]